jgi:predicted Zn-dependent protease
VWKDASTFLPALVTDAPRSFRSQWAESSLQYDAGNRQAGERLLRESLRTYPLFPNTWQELGARMQQEGRWREAAGAFAITFKLDPKRVVTAALAVDNYTRAGMLDSAQVIAMQAHAVDPDQVTLLRTMGNLAEAAHDPLRAMTYRRRVAWLDPATPANWYWTARSALDAGYCPEAERSLRELRALRHSTPEVDTLLRRSVEAGCAA